MRAMISLANVSDMVALADLVEQRIIMEEDGGEHLELIEPQ